MGSKFLGDQSSNIQMKSFTELFGANEPSVSKGDAIQKIPISEIHDFKNHPFRVLDDERMEEMVSSVRANGVLVPVILRTRPEGGYELISGHRRKRASILAGATELPAFVRDYSDDEATVIMVDSNIQREELLPSEKAKAYSMKYHALKHQGIKGGITLEAMSEGSGECGKTIQRYVWLARLNDTLLEMVDCKKIGIMQGVCLSFLKESEQTWLEEIFEEEAISVSDRQAMELKQASQDEILTREKMVEILNGVADKPKPRRFVLKGSRLLDYFPEETTESEIEEVIIGLLEEWKAAR